MPGSCAAVKTAVRLVSHHFFDFNLSLAAVGIPRIDPEKGNVFTRDFLSNETCSRILQKHLPDRAIIQNAITQATESTVLAFPKESFRYQLFEDYILQTYDYFSHAVSTV